MRPDKNLHIARYQSLMYLLSLFLAGRAGKQLGTHSDGTKQTAQRLIMLRSQNFGRRHHTCLIPIIHRHKHSHKSNKSLAAAHIALQKTIHLPTAAHIGPDLFQYPLLRTRQLKRQTFAIKTVEMLAYRPKRETSQTTHTLAGVPQYIELQIKEFLELQSELCLTQHIGRLGKMYIIKRFVEINHMSPGDYGRRKRLGKRAGNNFPQRSDDFLYRLRIEKMRLHFLGRRIIRLQACVSVDFHIDGIDFGMSDIQAAAEKSGTPEKRIFRSGLVSVLDILDSFEPDQLYRTRGIGKNRGETTFVTFALRLVTHNLSTQLYIRHRPIDFPYGISTRTIDILIRIIIQQILIRVNTQLLIEQLRPFRTDAGKELYIVHRKFTHRHIISQPPPNQAVW